MQTIRTPDERFQNLPGYPFVPHYSMVDGIRMHYVDEGKPDSLPIVMLHGEPTWSYLYRNMIPVFLQSGYRVLAPDFIGFGRSDKLVRQQDYSYERLVGWTTKWFQQVKIRPAVLVCQDWGSFIGLRIVAQHPELFAGVVVANGFLPDGQVPLSLAFHIWRFLARFSPVLPAGWIVGIGCTKPLSRDVRDAYNAPFPDKKYQTAVRALPGLVPVDFDDPESSTNRKMWAELSSLEKPFLTVFGDHDPVFRGMDNILQNRIPGTQGYSHKILSGAGHYIQEDRGIKLADMIIRFICKNLH